MSAGLFDRRDEMEELSLPWLSWWSTYLLFIIYKRHSTFQKGWRGAGILIPRQAAPDTAEENLGCGPAGVGWGAGAQVALSRRPQAVTFVPLSH